jgi:hypothetical protein
VIDFRVLPERPQQPLATAPYHQWLLPDGTPWTAFHRRPEGFLLRFPDLADFEVSADGQHVNCLPVPGIGAGTIDHLYLNQVLPLALSKLGKLVFHASAVDIADHAVAFLGASGRGKSTLAANFAVNGYPFLTDDGLVLESAAGGFLAQPSHASVRLWQDSHERLLSADAAMAPPVEYTSKSRFLAGDELSHCQQPRPRNAADVLGEGHASDVTFRPMNETDALLAWTQHSFLIDIEDKGLIGAHFHEIAALANRIPCYHLDYPRRYEDLSSLLDAIVTHATCPGTPA